MGEPLMTSLAGILITETHSASDEEGVQLAKLMELLDAGVELDTPSKCLYTK